MNLPLKRNAPHFLAQNLKHFILAQNNNIPSRKNSMRINLRHKAMPPVLWRDLCWYWVINVWKMCFEGWAWCHWRTWGEGDDEDFLWGCERNKILCGKKKTILGKRNLFSFGCPSLKETKLIVRLFRHFILFRETLFLARFISLF